MSGVDLSFVATDDLLEALKVRFDHLIFAGLRVTGAGRHDPQTCLWNGHVLFCQGLALDLVRDMQDWTREPEEEEDA